MFHNANEINFQLEWPSYSQAGSHEHLGLTWSDAPAWIYWTDTGAKSAFPVTLEDRTFTVRFTNVEPELVLWYQDAGAEMPFVLQPGLETKWTEVAGRCAFYYDTKLQRLTVHFERMLSVDGGILIVGTIDLGGDSNKPS